MGLYSRGLIFEWFFCRQIIGLIFEGAYNRGGLYSRFYGISDNNALQLDKIFDALYLLGRKQTKHTQRNCFKSSEAIFLTMFSLGRK